MENSSVATAQLYLISHDLARRSVEKAFTAAALSQPFTIFTRRRKTPHGQRFYALVHTADGHDLAELLVKNGLARIYGVRTPLPDGRDSRDHLAKLAAIEADAKRKALGGWRHH